MENYEPTRKEKLIVAGMFAGMMAVEWAGWQFFMGPLIQSGALPTVINHHGTSEQIAQFVFGSTMVGTPVIAGIYAGYLDAKQFIHRKRQNTRRKRG